MKGVTFHSMRLLLSNSFEIHSELLYKTWQWVALQNSMRLVHCLIDAELRPAFLSVEPLSL